MNFSQSYPATGEVIDGKYQIEKMLGEGGMGAVAKAIHLLRRAPVALKFMAPSVVSVPGAVERFLNEGVAASQIDSDNVVHIFDVGKLANGSPYLVMEYMEGHDLAEVLAREGKPGLDPTRSIYFIVQALRGLQVAHDAGIIHRDMKPSNCFVVNKEGEADFVKLLDFGISKVGAGKSASLTQTNSALGTPLYMSPEQARSPRDVDLRSDLYSVGVILYELLSGRTPFNSESGEFTEILFKLFTTEPPPLRSFRPDISPALAAAVHKALARDPNDRYATARDFAVALEEFADERATRVLQRVKAHQPGRGSQIPAMSHAHSAEPVAAFSKLSTGGAVQAKTNEMPGAGPSHGHALPRETVPLPHGAGAGLALTPAGAGSRASGADAIAATQYDAASSGSGGGAAAGQSIQHTGRQTDAGKQTDLGASRDMSVSAVGQAPARKNSPFLYIVPVAVILGVGGAGMWKLSSDKAAQDAAAGASSLSAEPPATAEPSAAPPPSASAVVLAVVPDAGALAQTAPSAAVTQAKRPYAPPTPPPSHPSDGRVHLKDLGPKE
jgi:serine/threonine-protein kinase